MIRPGIRRLFRLALHRPDIVEHDVAEEIRTHLDLRTEQFIREGLSPEAARAEARRRFGPLFTATRELRHVANERDRTMRIREWFDTLRQDIRYAARGLRREPMFAMFIVATLALGIGANAAMFGVVDRLLLRGPEHITAPSRVMRVYETEQPTGMNEFTTNTFGYVMYELLRHDAHSFEGVAAYVVLPEGRIMGHGADATPVSLGQATADLFPLVGVKPALGRFFTASEDRTSGAEHVAVIGYALWQHSYGGDRGVLGRTITLNEAPYTIVGVAPRGFTGPELSRADVWLPMSLLTTFSTTDDWTRTWNGQWLRIVARLKAGVTPEAASADATAAYRHAYNGGDKTDAAARLFVAPLSFNGQGKESTEVAVSRWLVGVAAVVLLIACSNVVNLLLARSLRRRREVAVRLALGAGRLRLVRLLLTESVMLAALGGAAGLLVALLTGRLMRTVLLSNVEWTSSPVDTRVLALSAGLALAVGILVGLLPAVRSSRPDLTAALKAGVREGGTQGSGLRAALTVAQASLSIVLLVGAGLFVRSLWNVRGLDLGIQPDRVLVVSPRWPSVRKLDQAAQDRENARRNDFYPRALERIRSLPGVDHAALTVGLSFRSSFRQDLRVPGWDSIPHLKGGDPGISAIGSDYLETVGTRLVRGRTFTPADRAGSESVALVNETMARTLWPARDPIGDCLFTGETKKNAICARIVGVVADARRGSLREDPAMHYYVPFGQERGMGGTELLVRPHGPPEALVPAVRALLQQLDPSITYVDAQSLQASVDPQIRPWRLGASVFGLMGVLALIVAAIGLYSVLSYLVAQRTHELGVRIALGARGGDILGIVLRSSLGMAVLGVATGLALSRAIGRFVAPLLFETSPADPGVLGGVAFVMLAVALLASLVPALKAKRVNPMEALRTE